MTWYELTEPLARGGGTCWTHWAVSEPGYLFIAQMSADGRPLRMIKIGENV